MMIDYIILIYVDVIIHPCHSPPGSLINPFNSLTPGRPGCQFHFKTAIFNLVLLIGIFTSSKDNALRWMAWDLTDYKSTLVQVMAWCRQATSHYLSQCWPSSMSPYGVTRPQWVKWKRPLMLYFVVRAESIILMALMVLYLCWHESFVSKHFHDAASSSSPGVVELLSIALPQFIADGCNKILLYCSWHTAINENVHFVNNALAKKPGHILQCFQLRNEMNVSTKLKTHCLFTRLLQWQEPLDIYMQSNKLWKILTGLVYKLPLGFTVISDV